MKFTLVMDSYQADGIKNILQIYLPEAQVLNLPLNEWEKGNYDHYSDEHITIIEINNRKTLETANNILATSSSLVMSDITEKTFVLDCFYLGAKGFLLKNNNTVKLIEAIKALSRGDIYVDQHVTKHILSKLILKDRDSVVNTNTVRPKDLLTNREWELLKVMAEDLSTKEIAEKLFVSESTVHYYSTSIQKKLNVKSRLGAVVKGLSNGWIKK